MPPLRLTISASVGRKYTRFLKSKLIAAHELIAPPLCEFSVALIGNEKMSSLHEEFLSDDSPTDVLTFELEHDDEGRVVAGEVVICVPVAIKQARERGTAVEQELLLYALHGMLHLCGYNDKTSAAYTTMHAREDEILIALGMGPVFANGSSPQARSASKSLAKVPREPSRAHTGVGKCSSI